MSKGRHRLKAIKKQNWLKAVTALYDVNKSISSTLQLTQVLELITRKSCQIIGADGCSLRLLHNNRKELILNAQYGLNKRSHLRKGNIRIGESIAGRVLKHRRVYLVRDLFREERYKYNFIVRKENMRSLLSVPLVEKNRLLGVLSLYSRRLRFFNRADVRLLSMFSSQACIAIANARLYQQARANYIGAIKFLANALDAKDSYTADHSENVAKIALAIARQLKLSHLQRDALQYASYLHDLGKVSVDLKILRKPEKLSSLEWECVYKHPQIGAQIINNIKALSNLVPIILHHHARYAGGGYPDKDISHERIPICSRILAVADAFEAMVSRRPYRKAFSKQQACEELLRCAGTQFDPQVVQAFLKIEQIQSN